MELTPASDLVGMRGPELFIVAMKNLKAPPGMRAQLRAAKSVLHLRFAALAAAEQ
jgi:hypothetical protein